MVDALTGSPDILVSGLPETIPALGSQNTYTLFLTCIGGNKYEIGSLASVDVTLTNIKEGKNLASVIDPTLFRNRAFDVTDINEQSLKARLQEIYPTLDVDSIQFKDFYYGSVKVEATSDRIYSGFINLTFKVNSTLTVNLYSGAASAEVYNSTRSDEISNYENLSISLGKYAFLAVFSNVDFNVTSSIWNNGDGKHDETQNIQHYLSGDVDLYNVYLYEYNGSENWDHCYSWFGFKWLNINDNDVTNDILQVEVKSSVKVFATAWNAEWARADSQTWLNYIGFYK